MKFSHSKTRMQVYDFAIDRQILNTRSAFAEIGRYEENRLASLEERYPNKIQTFKHSQTH